MDINQFRTCTQCNSSGNRRTKEGASVANKSRGGDRPPPWAPWKHGPHGRDLQGKAERSWSLGQRPSLDKAGTQQFETRLQLFYQKRKLRKKKLLFISYRHLRVKSSYYSCTVITCNRNSGVEIVLMLLRFCNCTATSKHLSIYRDNGYVSLL